MLAERAEHEMDELDNMLVGSAFPKERAVTEKLKLRERKPGRRMKYG